MHIYIHTYLVILYVNEKYGLFYLILHLWVSCYICCRSFFSHYFIVWPHGNVFIQPTVDGHVGNFQLGAICWYCHHKYLNCLWFVSELWMLQRQLSVCFLVHRHTCFSWAATGQEVTIWTMGRKKATHSESSLSTYSPSMASTRSSLSTLITIWFNQHLSSPRSDSQILFSNLYWSKSYLQKKHSHFQRAVQCIFLNCT